MTARFGRPQTAGFKHPLDEGPKLLRLCRTCRYWDGPRPANGELKGAGLCRFAAPQESAPVSYHDADGATRTAQRGVWPLTIEGDWCGEWTERNERTELGDWQAREKRADERR